MRRFRSDTNQSRGATLVEFSLVIGILITMIIGIVDISRMMHAQSVMNHALAYAIKRSQSESYAVVEIDQLSDADPDYLRFKQSRSNVINQINHDLKSLSESNTVQFYSAHDIDELRHGLKTNSGSIAAYLLPGTASVFSDPHDQSFRVTEHNRNICRANRSVPVASESLVEHWAASSDNCHGTRRGTETFRMLAEHYPLELVTQGRFNGMLLRGVNLSARAAGYLPKHGAIPPSVYETPTPEPSLTPTPQPTQTRPLVETPTQTPYPTETATPLITPPTFLTPTITTTPTQTFSPQPTVPPVATTAVATATITHVPPTVTPIYTNTPRPTATVAQPTPTPTPAHCQFYTLKKSASMQSLKSAYDEVMRWKERRSSGEKWQLFSGAGKNLSCLNRMVTDALHECNTKVPAQYRFQCLMTEKDGYWLNQAGSAIDDWWIMRHFFDPAPISGFIMLMNLSSTFGCIASNYQPAACAGLERASQPFHFKKQFIDKNCNLVDSASANQICGDLSIDVMISPISMIAGSNTKLPRTIARFAINPYSPERWTIWRGSSTAPLLALDRDKNGRIDDGTELFGEWFRGGISGTNERTPWKNGFEALRSLDSDGSGSLEGNELIGVLAWFDRNQNAISEEGELKSLLSIGIRKIRVAQAYRPLTGRDLMSDDSVLIDTNGEEARFSLIDWYSHTYPSPLEAINSWRGDAEPGDVDDNAPISAPPVKTDLFEQSGHQSLGGFWTWTIDGSDGADSGSNGYFMFVQEGSKIAGYTVSEELIVPNSKSDVRSVMSSHLLFGVRDYVDNQPGVRFGVISNDTRVANTAYLAQNGLLIGESQVIRGGQSLTYRWRAKRLE
jgi:hypothetical protein